MGTRPGADDAGNAAEAATPQGADDTRICLGHVTGAQGIKGEVRIKTYTEGPTGIGDYGALEDEPGVRRFEITSVRAVKGGAVARFAGIDGRDAAEKLKGVGLYVDRSRLPAPDDDSWYHADLVGLVAINADGAAIGTVVTVQNFGAGDLLELRPAQSGNNFMLPFTRDVVQEVDIKAGWMLVAPPPGLLDDD